MLHDAPTYTGDCQDDDDLRHDVAILRERRGGVSRPLTLTELRRRQRGQRQH